MVSDYSQFLRDLLLQKIRRPIIFVIETRHISKQYLIEIWDTNLWIWNSFNNYLMMDGIIMYVCSKVKPHLQIQQYNLDHNFMEKNW